MSYHYNWSATSGLLVVAVGFVSSIVVVSFRNVGIIDFVLFLKSIYSSLNYV